GGRVRGISFDGVQFEADEGGPKQVQIGYAFDGSLAPKVAGPAMAKGNAKPDPGSLSAYRGRINESFDFDVVGMAGGSVWGSGPYTDDSTLASAAVHSGALTHGQRGIVRVTILPPNDHYEPSSQNGVTTG